MGRPKGFPKTGGRKVGSPNKSSRALQEKLDELGCDPIEGLAKIAMDPTTTSELRFRCFAELAQYAYPKRKAVDLPLKETDTQPIIVEFIGGSGNVQPSQVKARTISSIGNS